MSTLKPKILLVPAWYPASFFQEQMELVDDVFDFKILKGERNELGKKRALKRILRGKFKQFTWIINKSDTDNKEIINIDFQYVNSLSKILERKQYKYLNNCFEKKINELINTGWKPDLIHIQSISDTAVFVCNWAQKNNIPVILTEHILFVRRKFDFFQREKELLYSRVNKVLCVSNYVYRNLLVNGFRMKSVEIIGNFVNDKFVLPKFENKEKHNKIVFVATHLADKDIDVLLQAAKILIDSNFSDFKIDIIGIDPTKAYCNNYNHSYYLKNEIDILQLSKHIDLKGTMNRKELLNSYRNYSFLISTSMSETFGLAPAEAIANGLPVLCTDSGGVRDFVNETNGIIVPIRDERALFNAIVTMINTQHNFNKHLLSFEIINKYGTSAFKKKLSDIFFNEINEKN